MADNCNTDPNIENLDATQPRRFKSINELFDALVDELDDLGYKQQEVITRYTRYLIEENRSCAEEFEKEISDLIIEERFGIGATNYIKTSVIRPLGRRYRK